METSYYETAQICLNGHTITHNMESSPELRSKFCDKCGAGTIHRCQKCGTNIRGYYHIPGVLNFNKYIVPGFCHECGHAYPWTEEKLSAAKELADLQDILTEDEREQLKLSLDDLVQDNPRTIVATTKFKRLLSKTGPEIASGFKDILVDVVSETVKKSIWG